MRNRPHMCLSQRRMCWGSAHRHGVLEALCQGSRAGRALRRHTLACAGVLWDHADAPAVVIVHHLRLCTASAAAAAEAARALTAASELYCAS